MGSHVSAVSPTAERAAFIGASQSAFAPPPPSSPPELELVAPLELPELELLEVLEPPLLELPEPLLEPELELAPVVPLDPPPDPELPSPPEDVPPEELAPLDEPCAPEGCPVRTVSGAELLHPNAAATASEANETRERSERRCLIRRAPRARCAHG
jgi:hypothetical protein